MNKKSFLIPLTVICVLFAAMCSILSSCDDSFPIDNSSVSEEQLQLSDSSKYELSSTASNDFPIIVWREGKPYPDHVLYWADKDSVYFNNLIQWYEVPGAWYKVAEYWGHGEPEIKIDGNGNVVAHYECFWFDDIVKISSKIKGKVPFSFYDAKTMFNDYVIDLHLKGGTGNSNGKGTRVGEGYLWTDNTTFHLSRQYTGKIYW